MACFVGGGRAGGGERELAGSVHCPDLDPGHVLNLVLVLV